jgi:hypothetical protein
LKYKYVTDFFNVGIPLSNTEKKKTTNSDTRNLVQYTGLFFRSISSSKFSDIFLEILGAAYTLELFRIDEEYILVTLH